MRRIFFLGLFLINYFFLQDAIAAEKMINLVIAYKTVQFAGKNVRAIAINNQIPGPTLHFKEGDRVTINVYNKIDKETALHWHGLIVPWQMDGVLGISQQGIQPGHVYHYQFKLLQSGTYWYHAHAGLQEQQGLYGALIIDPIKKPNYRYTKDYVIVLSDWSNTDPEHILANLKKSGDYYSPRFPLQPSLAKFIHDYRKASPTEKNNLLEDYHAMQKMRMSIYDISDVAYDAFLLNGQSKTNPWIAPVQVGDVVRLRFIDAGATAFFRIKIPGTSMQMVHIEGNDVRPFTVNDFTIAPGETYDVLVKIQKNNPYIIYAESRDKVGVVYGALTTALNQSINFKSVKPFPEPLPVTREMMAMMMGAMDMPMDHSMPMDMPTEPAIVGDKIETTKINNTMPMHHGMMMHHPNQSSSTTTSAGTKYQNIIAAVKTNDPNKPVDGVIKMDLFGYMDRFIWFINGEPEYKAKPIVLQPGKRYRFVFTNTSMMHHPMHFHGHWFILRKGNGEYDPLLHTIDIPPGATITADVDTDASGQWIFHCHLLYHMMSGMSRTMQYSTLLELTHNEIKPQHISKKTQYYNRPIVRVDEVQYLSPMLVHHPMAHAMNLNFANWLDVGEDPFHNAQRFSFKGLYGKDYNKLELFINDAEISRGIVQNADIDIFYWHLLNQFWAIKGGVNYMYRPALTPYWQPGIGIEGLMPYFIDADARGYYRSGSAKLDLELSRDTQITNNFLIRLGVRGIAATKTINQFSIGSGLNQMRYIVRPYYRIMPGLNVFVEYEHQQDYGPFKNNQAKAGLDTVENTVMLGISILF